MEAGSLHEFSGLATRPKAQWGPYRRWNSAICQYFFSGRFAYEPVYLDIDEATLQSVHRAPSGEERRLNEDLISAVKRTLDLTGNRNPFHQHMTLCAEWELESDSSFPPFSALLGLFSNVAETMVASEDFAPNNYYGRLRRLLGVQEVLHESIVRGYREATAKLWPALNGWLKDWDGGLGLPTARALDHRKYVSTAISQALVREHDRLILRRMFSDVGLEARQSLESSEMLSVLLYWARAGHEATSLGRLLRKGKDILERVVEIACAELQAWDGRSGATTRAVVESRLSLVAQVRSHPLPRLDLYLTIPVPADSKTTSYRLAPDSSGIARSAFSRVKDELTLERVAVLDLMSLEPWADISAGDVILAPVDLVPKNLGHPRLVRAGQPICVLSFRDGMAAYKEVAQASLMDRLLILAHDDVAPKVQTHLESCARPGFRLLQPPALQGLPNHWSAFMDVQIIQRVEEKGLEAITPLGERRLLLSGGLSLGRDTWHRAAPPEVLIADTKPDSSEVIVQQTSVVGEEVSDSVLGSFEGNAAFKLSCCALPEGNYRIVVRDPAAARGKLLHHAEFRLMSSNYPRAWIVAEQGRLAHRVSVERPWGLLSAESNMDAVNRNSTYVAYVRGPHVHGGVPVAFKRTQAPLPSTPGVAAVAEDELPRTTFIETETVTAGSCVQRGYHHFMFDFVPPGTERGHLVRGSCNECHVEIWKRTGGVPAKRGRPSNTPLSSIRMQVRPSTRSATPALPAREQGVPTPEILFDAVNLLRAGSFTQLASLVSAVHEGPWAAHEFLRELSALGHVDIERDPSTLRPLRWQMSKTYLSEIDATTAAVIGWRSPHFLSQIKVIVEGMGGTLEQDMGASGLPLVFVTGIDCSKFAQLCVEVMDRHDIEIEDIVRASGRLLAVLPPLSLLVEKLPIARPPTTDLEIFDFSKSRWGAVAFLNTPGAYRAAWRGTSYFFVSEDGLKRREGRLADARTVKHLAAFECGYNLVGYSEESRTLLMPLGCELPGLIERAAVMCSGRPPNVINGMARYGGVDIDTANQIWARLTS